jgi:hypothetical protein
MNDTYCRQIRFRRPPIGESARFLKKGEISRDKNEQKTNAEITYRLCDAIFCLQGRAPTIDNDKQCRMQAQTTTSHNRMPAGVFRPLEGSHIAAS